MEIVNKRNPNGEISIDLMGAELKIHPIRLYKNSIHENSQKILNQIIEVSYKTLINNAKDIVCNRSNEELAVLKEQNEPNQQILDLATFTRNILPLHEEAEFIQLQASEEDTVELAHGIWKYSTLYGFISSEIHNGNI